jgi:1,2-diacylglycerol 3-alpha-glucosyltransferase
MVIDPWLQPFNGTVVSTRRFVTALEARGCAVTLLAIGGEAPAAPPADREMMAFSRLSVPGFNRLIDAMRAPLARPDRARIRQALGLSDLLHVQYPFLLGYAAIGEARRMGLPVVCSFHVQPENILINIGLNWTWLRNLLYRLFAAALYDRADLVIAPTAFAAELLRASGVTRPIEIVSNGAPEDFFHIVRNPTPAVGRRLRLLSVGRLAKEKRQETLLHAIAACAHRAQIELTLAGAGPRDGELKALASTLGLDVRIGPVSDEELRALYAGADLFVHCGGVELEGMSVLEAMAAGVPVIVSDSPDSAAAHLVSDDRMRFRAGDFRHLALRMDDWLSHPDDLAAQGRDNRLFASAFSHERSVARLLSIYAAVVAHAPPRRADKPWRAVARDITTSPSDGHRRDPAQEMRARPGRDRSDGDGSESDKDDSDKHGDDRGGGDDRRGDDRRDRVKAAGDKGRDEP